MADAYREYISADNDQSCAFALSLSIQVDPFSSQPKPHLICDGKLSHMYLSSKSKSISTPKIHPEFPIVQVKFKSHFLST